VRVLGLLGQKSWGRKSADHYDVPIEEAQDLIVKNVGG